MSSTFPVVGVGVFGTGLSASQHLAGIAGASNGRVVAIAGRSLAKAQTLAEQCRIPRVYAGFPVASADVNAS